MANDSFISFSTFASHTENQKIFQSYEIPVCCLLAKAFTVKRLSHWIEHKLIKSATFDRQQLMASTFFLLEPLVFLCLSIDSIMKMVGEWHFSYKMISNFECLLRETCAIDVNGKLILITCVNAVTLPVALHSETQCLSSLTQRVSRNI